MDNYIEGNKAAWEEAFDKRDASWGADITERISNEEYAFFNEETIAVLKTINTEGKVIGQFCCNNGRELLSLVKTGKVARGVGFDIAENQVAFANGTTVSMSALTLYSLLSERSAGLTISTVSLP